MGVPVKRGALPIAALVVALPCTAHADPRPTEGGLWAFETDDVVETWDAPGGRIRVHYSSDGPNQTNMFDDDEDLVPDYVALVGTTVDDALTFFTDSGFRPPLPETEVGPELGGSAALDVYLIDFGGAADGALGIDDCTPAPVHCSAFVILENDFSGYGYPSIEVAVDTVGSHELFHAVQNAYARLPVWMSEGTATWAEKLYDPSSQDFINQCQGYMGDTGRPIYSPPPGPVPAFAYGTALWFDFLASRHDADIIEEILVELEASGDPDTAQYPMETAIEARGDSLLEAWPTFARWNLAAGFRTGAAESHPYAGQLDAITADAEGASFDLDARLFPLAASYWRLDHPGGVLYFGADQDLPGTRFSLHPVAEFAEDGAVGDAISTWDAEQAGAFAVFDGEDLPAGGYWIVATLAAIADGSSRARVCIGDETVIEPCDVAPDPGTDTDMGTGDGSTGGGPGSTGTPPDPDTGDDATDGDDTDEPPAQGDGGCGCRSAPSPTLALAMVLPVLFRRRRR